MGHSLALVTGASSGIGRALCTLLADQGIHLIISGRDTKKLEELANTLRAKVEVQILPADLTDRNQRKTLIDVIRQRIPDLVINNAGFGLYYNAVDYDTKQQLDILEVDGLALLELTLEASKALKEAKKEGVIMNISSVAAFFVFPSLAVYAATKCFVNQLSQALDIELKPYGIRVLAACPGMVDTSFRERSGGVPLDNASHVMSADFAANEIWTQIQKKKPLHIFDWQYRAAVWASALIPKWLYTKLLMNNIKNRGK